MRICNMLGNTVSYQAKYANDFFHFRFRKSFSRVNSYKGIHQNYNIDYHIDYFDILELSNIFIFYFSNTHLGQPKLVYWSSTYRSYLHLSNVISSWCHACIISHTSHSSGETRKYTYSKLGIFHSQYNNHVNVYFLCSFICTTNATQ